MVASPMTVRITAPLRSIATVAVAIMVTIEVEHLEQVPDGRAVAGHIGIMLMRDRVRQVIAAARRERLEVPIALDEFQDRDMVVVGVHHPAARENGETTMNGMGGRRRRSRAAGCSPSPNSRRPHRTQ